MKIENAIEVKNVSKSFKIFFDKGKMLKERVLFKNRNKYEVHKVLDDISFEIKKGEAVGLVGHNGCGKSTTLKLLTRIMYPDSGTIEMSGRVSSLLELGAGFHPDMSGRENIYINASIFGLSKKEIDKRINTIIEFSELGEFIDNPVRTYSSGMYMRLAFSVAINVDADILLIDEILAVGDVNFQTKCFNKLMEIKRNGTTIVLVSHSTGQIEQVCERSIWIHDGQIKLDGNPREVHQQYLKYMGELRAEDSRAEDVNEEETIENETSEETVINEEHHRGTGEARIINVVTLDSNDNEKKVFMTGETIKFRVNYKVYKNVEQALFGLSIFRIDGVRAYGSNSQVDGEDYYKLNEDGKIDVCFDNANLLAGKYYLDVCISRSYEDMIDYFDTICEFEVYNTTGELGVIRMKHMWGV